MKTPASVHGEYSDAPHPVAKDVTAFILTGGKSERMGRDKAAIETPQGGTLLERAIATAATVAGQVAIVGPRERYAGYAWAGEIVEDMYAGRGPLAGIHAALTSSQTEWNIVLAVDLPFVTPELLSWMLRQARASNAQVTVAQDGGRLHPLCAVYRKDFSAVANGALEAGRNKIDAAFVTADTRIVTEQELRQAGFETRLFANVNTPEELAQAFGNVPPAG